MGFFSKMMDKRRHNKRLKQTASHPHKEYLLSEDTPFDVNEAFRKLKTTLSVAVPKKQGGLEIIVTSAYPEDGKTTVTTNLALMFAQSSNVKVLLLDADIRKGRVAKYFKCKSAPGLSDYLSGQNSLEEVVRKTEINPNLSFITCGTHAPKPYELLESAKMQELLTQLREEYDYIIIDTPPVLLVSDALAIAPATDGVVMLCRHQVSYMGDISRALNTLHMAKVNVLGLIVNDYKATAVSNRYGSYKKYNYYTSYNYNYISESIADRDYTPDENEQN